VILAASLLSAEAGRSRSMATSSRSSGMACFAPLAVLAAGRRIRRIDAEASIPVVEMGVLRNTEIFSALPAASLERACT
jgi:hypothetical protein